MDKKDKIILQDSALAVVDGIASAIPGMNIAWGLSKALLGAGLKLRQAKALEWVEMVRDNPSIITEEILRDDMFQDGFVYMLEKYIVERDESKRKIFRNIFLGFAQSENKADFPLEKFTHTLSQLNGQDIATIKDAKEWENGAPGDDSYYQIYKHNDIKNLDNIHNLLSLGLLLQSTTSHYGQIKAPFVKISEFGHELIKYLTE